MNDKRPKVTYERSKDVSKESARFRENSKPVVHVGTVAPSTSQRMIILGPRQLLRLSLVLPGCCAKNEFLPLAMEKASRRRR